MRTREEILNDISACSFNNFPRLRLLVEELDTFEYESLTLSEAIAYACWCEAFVRGAVN